MPEELNRLLTDQLADLLVHHRAAAPRGNLAREGVDPARVHFVGNTMIDTLDRLLPLARGGEALRAPRAGHARGYGLVTLHGPSNVDDAGAALERWSPLWTPSPSACRSCGRSIRAPDARLDELRPAGLRADPARRASCSPSRSATSTSCAHGRRPPGAHRLGRHPGGDDRARRALPHAADDHGAAGHRRRGHEPSRRSVRQRSASSRAVDEVARGADAATPSGRSCGTATRRSASWPSSRTGRRAIALRVRVYVLLVTGIG